MVRRVEFNPGGWGGGHSPNLTYSKGIGSHAAAIPVLKVV